MGIITAYVQVATDDVLPVPIDGVLVNVYDPISDAFLTGGLTGSGSEPHGQISFPLNGSVSPGTLYVVRLFKPGVSFAPGPTQTISVINPLGIHDTNIFPITGHIFTRPESTDPDLCLISGFITDVSLRPLSDVIVEFRPTLFFPGKLATQTSHFYGTPSVVRTNILGQGVKAKTDSNGYLRVMLPRTGTFDVHVFGDENPLTICEYLTVPDEAAFALEDLLFSYIKQVTLTPAGTINLSLGQQTQLTIDALNSDERHLSTVTDLAKLLNITTQDPTIAFVGLTRDGILTVEGVNPGTTQILVSRVPNTVAPRRPAVADLIFSPPTVAVS